MGASMKRCWSDDEQQKVVINKSAETVPSDIYRDQITIQSHRQTGSLFGHSQLNSFYRENQIGPYFNQDEGASYIRKWSKWKNLLLNNPYSRRKNQHSNSSLRNISDHKTDVFIRTDGFHAIQNSHQQDLNAESRIAQETQSLMNNNIDKAILHYNTTDKEGLRQDLIDGPPKMQIRWSCWKVRILRKRQLEDSVNNSRDDPGIAEQIRGDVYRTAGEHPFFRNGQGKDMLEKALKHIAKKFPKIGYSQGSNFVVAFVLQVSGGKLAESQIFLTELLISPKFMLYFLYINGSPLLEFLEALTLELMKKYLTRIFERLQKLGIGNPEWLTKIVLTLFVNSFQNCQCLRFWDFMMATDIFGLVSLVLAFVDIYSATIMKFNQTTFNEWFQGFRSNDVDVTAIINVAYRTYRITHSMVARQAENMVSTNPHAFIKALQKYDSQDKNTFKQALKALIK